MTSPALLLPLTVLTEDVPRTPCMGDADAWFTPSRASEAAEACHHCPLLVPCRRLARRELETVSKEHRHGVMAGLDMKTGAPVPVEPTSPTDPTAHPATEVAHDDAATSPRPHAHEHDTHARRRGEDELTRAAASQEPAVNSAHTAQLQTKT